MKREEQRVLAGSLNLLPPSDKTPENDAIVLQNCRVDQQGVLRMAYSFARMTQVGGGSAAIHTIFKLDDFSTTQAYVNGIVDIAWGVGLSGGGEGVTGALLVGAGDALYFYWPAGTAGAGFTATLASGLSGAPLSIVVWNGFIWVLDSLFQFKLDPAQLVGLFGSVADSLSAWLPAVPSTPIVAVANTGGGGALDDSATYTYYCTYVLYGPTSSGGFLVAHESAGGPGTSGITPLIGVNSITGLPYVTASGGVAVDAIRVYRQKNSGSVFFLKQFGYGLDPTGAWCGVPLTATFPTNTLYFLDSVAAISSVVMPVSGDPAAPTAPVNPPTVVAGIDIAASAGLVGTYEYYLTYVNSAGLETNPGPVSNQVTPGNGQVDLTWATPPTDQDIKAQRLYREGGTLGSAYQVIQFSDAVTTSYTDGLPDLTITETGIIMPTTNDPPPTGTAAKSMGVVGPYFNALLAWKDKRLYWSQNGVPLFPGSEDGNTAGNWVDVGAPDDAIQNITLHPILCAIHKQRSVWRCIGDIVTGTLMDTSATCGAIGKQAVANCGPFDLYLSQDGVYKFALDSTSSASDKLAPVFLGKQWIGLGASDLTQPFWGTPQQPFLAFLNGSAVFGNGGSFTGDDDGAAFLYHAATERFASFGSSFGNAITAALGFGSQYQWFAGDELGYLMVSQQVAGSVNNMIWQTRFLDQGLGDTPKFYQEIVLDAELNGGDMDVWLLFDNTSDAPALSTVVAPFHQTFGGAARAKCYMPLPQDEGDTGEYHISVRTQIVGVPGNVPPAIHGLYIYYGIEERDASVRGTQVLDFLSERIDMCRRIEVDQVGEVTLKIWTDEPSGLALRYTYTGAPTGRAVFEFNLPPNVRGRLWRIDVLPVGEARVYTVRGWMREVGDAEPGTWEWKTFIAGAQAEEPDAE